MAQSLAKIYAHIIFRTKNQDILIDDNVRVELHRYMIGILNKWECPALKIGSVEDHVHILCMLSRNYPVKKILEEVKKGSSKWLKTKGSRYSNFQWQNGYGIFSVSQSKIESVDKYIENQKEHHRRESFQDEYRRFLKAYNIEYDERYVWD